MGAQGSWPSGGRREKFRGAALWNRSSEKTGDVVFGPCGIVNATDRAREKAPHRRRGISSSPQRQEVERTYRAQKRFSLDPFRQKLWSKPLIWNSCRCFPSSTGFLRSKAVSRTGATSPGGKREIKRQRAEVLWPGFLERGEGLYFRALLCDPV